MFTDAQCHPFRGRYLINSLVYMHRSLFYHQKSVAVRSRCFSSSASGVAPGLPITDIDALKVIEEKLLKRFHNQINTTWTAISFYRFFTPDQQLSEERQKHLIPIIKIALSDIKALGTFLLSNEGYNAALAIPTPSLLRTYKSLRSADSIFQSGLDFNIGKTFDYGPNFDHSYSKRTQKGGYDEYNARSLPNREPTSQLSSQPTNQADHVLYTSTSCPSQVTDNEPIGVLHFPFKKLVVRCKLAVLTDGLRRSTASSGPALDWTDAGPELLPEQWHLELARGVEEEPPLILDCRNNYESRTGTFANAVPLNTNNFSETWEKLQDLLISQNIPKERRVLTYCTGGIRCVKVNAFLKRMGYTNLARLHKGVIAYEQWIETKNEKGVKEESLFKGKNFLFDRRRLTKDDLSGRN